MDDKKSKQQDLHLTAEQLEQLYEELSRKAATWVNTENKRSKRSR